MWSWKTSTLATGIVAAALATSACNHASWTRLNQRVSAAHQLESEHGPAADLARHETLQWLTTQEALRREGDTPLPRHPRQAPPPEASEPAISAAEPPTIQQTARETLVAEWSPGSPR